MKIFLSILATFLIAIAGLFGYSYATKGAAKDFIDKLKGGTQIEQPNEKPPSDSENPNEPEIEPPEIVPEYSIISDLDWNGINTIQIENSSSDLTYTNLSNTGTFENCIYTANYSFKNSCDFNFAIFGGSFRACKNYSILLRVIGDGSLDIIHDGTRYCLINNDITSLCKDILENSSVKFEFGRIKTNKNEILYGFRFVSETCEVSYFASSDKNISDYSTLNGSDIFFISETVSSTNGTKTQTLDTIFAPLQSNPITHTTGWNCLGAVSQYNSNDLDNQYMLLTCENTSEWFIEKCKHYNAYNFFIDAENGHNYIDCNQFENDIKTEIT